LFALRTFFQRTVAIMDDSMFDLDDGSDFAPEPVS
jgi:hypothetical protein